MASKSKNKGSYHERSVLDWLTKSGIKAKKQPLSGSLGGEYSGDLKLEHHNLIAEVKYRAGTSFPSPFTVLHNRDLAFYKRKSGDPKMIVVMTIETFLKLMESNNGITERSDTQLPQNRQDFDPT